MRKLLALVDQGGRQAGMAAVALAVLLLAPAAAEACPVCFGAAEGPMIDAMNGAILLLLGVTAGVLGGFVVFFVKLMRRAAQAEMHEDVPGYASR